MNFWYLIPVILLTALLGVIVDLLWRMSQTKGRR